MTLAKRMHKMTQLHDEMTQLHDEMERLLSRTFGTGLPLGKDAWTPSVDVHEENGNLLIKADLPGIKKEDVEITVTDKVVTLEGHAMEEKEEKRDGYYHHERNSGRFIRVIPLPMEVDTNKAHAAYQDGTVTITLPKLGEAPKGQKITVR